jgi:hypothetical protein
MHARALGDIDLQRRMHTGATGQIQLRGLCPTPVESASAQGSGSGHKQSPWCRRLRVPSVPDSLPADMHA